jgi:FkbM family methyltransferase
MSRDNLRGGVIVRNVLAYYSTRVLQKLGLASLSLAVGGQARCAITNPPGVLKCFTTLAGRAEVESDASLMAVRKLVRSAASFWDVGANCGLFSLYALDENPNLFVMSIEASTQHYHSLCSNWLLRPSEHWVCLHTAVGDRDGTAHLSQHMGGWNHIVEGSGDAGRVDSELRPLMTLDSIARHFGVTMIDVLKIDVEGYELKALRGAVGLLEQQRVGAIVLESDGHGSRYNDGEVDITRFLEECGYRLNPSMSLVGRGSGNCLVFERSEVSEKA